MNNIKDSLAENGIVVIQTLHPYFLVSNGLEYRSQMISDSWKVLPGNFLDGHQWYARTIEDWSSVISKAGLKIIELREILNHDKNPISLILKIS